MFADCTLASMPLSLVVHGRPRGLLQSLGGRSDALTARLYICLHDAPDFAPVSGYISRES